MGTTDFLRTIIDTLLKVSPASTWISNQVDFFFYIWVRSQEKRLFSYKDVIDYMLAIVMNFLIVPGYCYGIVTPIDIFPWNVWIWMNFLECLNLNQFCVVMKRFVQKVLSKFSRNCLTKRTLQFSILKNQNFSQSLVYFLLFQATICPKCYLLLYAQICYLSTFWIQDASEFVENIYDLRTNGIRLHIRFIFFYFFYGRIIFEDLFQLRYWQNVLKHNIDLSEASFFLKNCRNKNMIFEELWFCARLKIRRYVWRCEC